MKRLALALAFTLAACGDTTGSQRVTFAVEAAGPERDAQPLAFDNDQGWSITLSEARVALGPVYLNTIAPLEGGLWRRLGDALLPSAYAHGGSHLSAGRIVGQVTTQVEVDVLAPAMVAIPGGGDGVGDAALTAEVWLYNRDGVLGGAAMRVAGVARRGAEEVTFEGSLVIDQDLVATGGTIDEARRVRGIPAPVTLVDGGSLRVRVDPRGWFNGADFSELARGTARDGRYRFSNTDNVGRAFAAHARSRSAFSISFAPPR